MARKPRLTIAGYYHIINRGVARKAILQFPKDKDKFLEILCLCANEYGFVVHSYCLMDNHYHLLMETTRDNLSSALRYINSNYAVYYNKKYKRVGHLWQGRFQSSYIASETYLFTLLRYIEQNPLKAGIVKKLSDYEYISFRYFICDNPLPCLLNSFVYDRFETKQEIAAFLNEVVDVDEEKQALKDIKNDKSLEEINETKKFMPLREYFLDNQSKTQRDEKILEAYRDGWSQGKIAKEIGISQPGVFKIVKKLRGF